jgi:hypothetical protein
LYASSNIIRLVKSRKMRWAWLQYTWESCEMHTNCWPENLDGKDHLENMGVNWRIILERILGWDVVDWIHLAQDRYRWQALVNTVMDLRVS